MNTSPIVSVIINCLNGERYLPAALDCLKGQTFQDFEIIFWDNGSIDGSADIAQAYGPRLKYFKSKQTVTLGEARNMAIAQSCGKYIAFLDCDDLWRPGKLQKQVDLFERNDKLGLVCTDTEICKGKKFLHNLFTLAKPARGNAFGQLMVRQWISMSSAMVSKVALDSIAAKAQAVTPVKDDEWFDVSLNVCEEADVFYRIAHDWEIDYIDEPLTVWRIHDSNTTFEKFGQFAEETIRIINKHRKLYPGYDKEYADIIEILQSRAAFQKAIALWRIGNSVQARKIISPHIHKSRKYHLFWYASFLPGSLFNFMSKIYFSLPAWLRK